MTKIYQYPFKAKVYVAGDANYCVGTVLAPKKEEAQSKARAKALRLVRGTSKRIGWLIVSKGKFIMNLAGNLVHQKAHRTVQKTCKMVNDKKFHGFSRCTKTGLSLHHVDAAE